MNSFLLGSLDIAAFLLCATFLAYVLMIVLALMRHEKGPPGDPDQFDWHFFIPCLNEEGVIEATVADLFRKVPTAHLWCIDDGSTDGTALILGRLARRSPRVHVVTRQLPDAQNGKGPALNAAWRALAAFVAPGTDLSRIIVGVIDADGILDPDCPKVITGPGFFGNPKVGAVQILVRVLNYTPVGSTKKEQVLMRMQDLEFTTIIAGMQMLRRHVGSTSMGGNGQFTRMSALHAVSEEYDAPWANALLEDFELGLRILLTGGLTEYCHDTWVAQQGLPTVRRLMRQRSRWAQGLMQCFRYFWPVMRSRDISTPAAMEIGYFLLLPWAQLIGILVYTASFGVLIYYAFTTVGGLASWFGAGAWGIIPLFLLFGLGPLMVWGPIYRRTFARNLRFREGAFLGFLNWPYIYVHHASTIWAFSRMLRSRHDWKKTERSDIRRRKPIRPTPETATPALAQAAAPVPARRTAPLPRPPVARPAGAPTAVTRPVAVVTAPAEPAPREPAAVPSAPTQPEERELVAVMAAPAQPEERELVAVMAAPAQPSEPEPAGSGVRPGMELVVAPMPALVKVPQASGERRDLRVRARVRAAAGGPEAHVVGARVRAARQPPD